MTVSHPGNGLAMLLCSVPVGLYAVTLVNAIEGWWSVMAALVAALFAVTLAVVGSIRFSRSRGRHR